MSRIFLLLTLIVFLTACTATPPVTLPSPTETVAVPATDSTKTVPPPSPTAAPAATETPVKVASLTAATPGVYTQEDWGVSFSYPGAWQPVEGREPDQIRYEGSDGFFELRGPFPGDSCDMLRACYQESEDPQADCQAYGEGVIGADRRLYLPLPGPMPGREAWVTLQVDPAHAEQIFSAIETDPEARVELWQTPAPVWYEWESIVDQEITTHEAFLESIADTGPSALCSMAYEGTVPEDLLAVHEPYRGPAYWEFENPLDLSVALMPLFGYQLEDSGNGYYTLKRGDVVVKNRIKTVRSYTSSVRQGDFAVVVETDAPAATWLVRQESIEEKVLSLDPVFVGQQLITVEPGADTAGETLEVKRDGELIFTYVPQPLENTVYNRHLVRPPAANRQLHSYGEHWALEVGGTLIVDGEVWNDTLPADEIYGFKMLYNKPFFFFTRAGTTGIWYDDAELSVTYDVVVHDHLAQPALNSPQNNEQMVWFFARRDSAWFYVEVMHMLAQPNNY